MGYYIPKCCKKCFYYDDSRKYCDERDSYVKWLVNEIKAKGCPNYRIDIPERKCLVTVKEEVLENGRPVFVVCEKKKRR